MALIERLEQALDSEDWELVNEILDELDKEDWYGFIKRNSKKT